MAQLVEQRIRNAWVAGSSPASGSLSWYPLDTSFFVLPNNARSAIGTGFSLWNAPWRLWNARKSLAAHVLFVGRTG